MRDAIHALKYDGLHPAARRLGAMLARAVSQLATEAPPEMLVIPVPLHRAKHAQRGFNQARLLAACALASLRRTHPAWHLTLAPNSVVRQRATESQAGLTPRQRRQNLLGAFVVADPKAVAGKQVLVIDDIMTTGATARSVAQVLLRSGADKVWVATLARARRAFDYRSNQAPVYSLRDLARHQNTGAESAPGQRMEVAIMHSSPKQPSF